MISYIYIFCCLHLCRPPKPLIPASPTSGHTQGSFCIVAPPLEVHRKWCQIIGGLPSEGDCYRVTLAVFSTACSDWTYAGHHLLCPLLTTMLAKSWSQIEWASPPQRPGIPNNPPMWTLRDLIELPQAREEGGTPRLRPPQRHGMMGYIFNFLIYAVPMRTTMITDDAMAVHFNLRLLNRAADHAYCQNYPGVNQVRELRHLQCWSSN